MPQLDVAGVLGGPLVRRGIERLIRAFAPMSIVVFGSRARDVASTRSDIDLLVVTECGATKESVRYARQLVADCFPPLDVLLCTPEDVANAPLSEVPFLASILSSGRCIYERSPR